MRSRAAACALVMLGMVVVVISRGGPALAASAQVTVDAAAGAGTVSTRLSTQIVYAGTIESTATAQSWLNSYSPPLVRLHAGADGCCWAGGPPPGLPEGVKKGDWNFASLDELIGNVRAYGGEPVMNVRYAPVWMWTCTSWGGAGLLRDQTYNEFGDYMARLVAYYNTGRMTTETGATITNPAGASKRMTYWEIWNEPDLSNETPCHPSDWGPALSAAQYQTMWNVVTAKMLAVDPSIKLVGPVNAGPITGAQYLTVLMGANHPPDVVSFHGYGGWDNGQSDLFLFDGDASCPECGLRGMAAGVAQFHALAPGRPVWITEMNVNAAYGNDPAGRPWGAYGAAWGASAFRTLVLGGVALVHQYQYIESPQFGIVDANTGTPTLQYWRDYYLSRYFPRGSTILSSTSTAAGVEVLAALSGSNVHVLVVNRQVPNASVVGSTGLPGTVQVTIGNVGTVTGATMRLIDGSTPAANGPPLVQLPASSMQTIAFAGYGAALLDFSTGGSPPPTTPPATETPPPTNPPPGDTPPPTNPPPGNTPPPTNPPPADTPPPTNPPPGHTPPPTAAPPSGSQGTEPPASGTPRPSPDLSSTPAASRSGTPRASGPAPSGSPLAALPSSTAQATGAKQSTSATGLHGMALMGAALKEAVAVLTGTERQPGAMADLIGADAAAQAARVLGAVGETYRAYEIPTLLGLGVVLIALFGRGPIRRLRRRRG